MFILVDDNFRVNTKYIAEYYQQDNIIVLETEAYQHIKSFKNKAAAAAYLSYLDKILLTDAGRGILYDFDIFLN